MIYAARSDHAEDRFREIPLHYTFAYNGVIERREKFVRAGCRCRVEANRQYQAGQCLKRQAQACRQESVMGKLTR